MPKLNFKNWIINEAGATSAGDIFGFEVKTNFAPPPVKDDPIKQLDFNYICEQLSKRKLGTRIGNHKFCNYVEWGSTPGAVEIDISPYGSLKANIRKLNTDLTGDPVWICKKMFRLKESLDTKSEDELIEELFEACQLVETQLLEMTKHEYLDFEMLIRRLNADLVRYAPPIFIYEGYKKLNKYNYLNLWSVRGQGVEAPTAARVEEFVIDVSFKEETGLIRVVGHDVASPTRSHKWISQPAEFDEHFMPSQTMQEIIEATCVAFSTY